MDPHYGPALGPRGRVYPTEEDRDARLAKARADTARRRRDPVIGERVRAADRARNRIRRAAAKVRKEAP